MCKVYLLKSKMLYCKPQNKPTETDEKIDYTVQASTPPSHLSTSKKSIISPFVVQLLVLSSIKAV